MRTIFFHVEAADRGIENPAIVPGLVIENLVRAARHHAALLKRVGPVEIHNLRKAVGK